VTDAIDTRDRNNRTCSKLFACGHLSLSGQNVEPLSGVRFQLPSLIEQLQESAGTGASRVYASQLEIRSAKLHHSYRETAWETVGFPLLLCGTGIN
jgi:hypothetical protein